MATRPRHGWTACCNATAASTRCCFGSRAPPCLQLHARAISPFSSTATQPAHVDAGTRTSASTTATSLIGTRACPAVSLRCATSCHACTRAGSKCGSRSPSLRWLASRDLLLRGCRCCCHTTPGMLALAALSCATRPATPRCLHRVTLTASRSSHHVHRVTLTASRSSHHVHRVTLTASRSSRNAHRAHVHRPCGNCWTTLAQTATTAILW
jgi:hypothetical protein